MNNLKQAIISSIGVATSFSSMAISTTELSDIVAIITAILGLLIVIIVNLLIPLIRWFIKAKKDGKIDSKEIIELTDTIQNGIEKIDGSLNKGKEDKNNGK